MATVMIIYYKQMSEGYEDQKRFQILSNVGLTEKEAKESIRTQVMLLFYLPVAAAIMHMIVASSVVRLFLRMILIVDTFTFNMAIAIVSMIFLVIYTIVYKITSREYYKIVNQKD
jgi:putative ABC transport system permease protein